jgi:hypothetical protein
MRIIALLVVLGCSDPVESAPTHTTLVLDPTAAVAPSEPAPAGPFAALAEYAAFSSDSTRFAYFSVSASGGLGDMASVWTTTAGSPDAEIAEMLFADEPETIATVEARMRTQGFDGVRRPVPEGLTMEPHLTAQPPTITLRYEGRAITAPLDRAPYPPSDVAELWGLSPDGRHVAIHVHGPQVAGVLTRSGAGTVRFFRVVALP